MNQPLFKDAFVWGFVLWLIGYALGFVFFFILPAPLIGWAIMPIGAIITVWVVAKKIKGESLRYYFVVAILWTAIAIVLDYLFIAKLLNPADGYYKLDVYIYYALTFILPPLIGRWKLRAA